MMAASTRSLLERLSLNRNDPWAHDSAAAEDAFTPRTRRPKREREIELDDEYQFTPWVDGLSGNGNETKEQRLHDEIVAFMTYVQPSAQEKTARNAVYEHIKKTIKSRFTRSEVDLFGSVAHDLCLPDGDLDVVIRLPGIEHPLDKKQCLFQLAGVLRASSVTNDVFVNHFARIPIATFVTVPNFGAYSFDIGINNTDGFEAVAIIGSYLDKMPALRPLVLVLKSFLKQRKLASAATSGLSSYGVICMVISFLQLNPTNQPSDFLSKPLETGSLGILLMDFFLYYGATFPLQDSYISVTQGKILPKESADWIKGRHKLAIECLVNPENDVGKSAGKIQHVMDAFREAHDAFKNFPFVPTPLVNILGSNNLARITQKTIDHRAHISRLVDSGNLLVHAPVDRFAEYRSQNRGGRDQRQYQRPPRRNVPVDDSYRSRGRDSTSGYGDSSGPSKRRRY